MISLNIVLPEQDRVVLNLFIHIQNGKCNTETPYIVFFYIRSVITKLGVCQTYGTVNVSIRIQREDVYLHSDLEVWT